MYSFYAVIIFVFICLTWYFYDECQKLVYIQIATTTSLKALRSKKSKIVSKIGYVGTPNPETGLDRQITKIQTEQKVKLEQSHAFERRETLKQSHAFEQKKDALTIQVDVDLPNDRYVAENVLQNSELFSP